MIEHLGNECLYSVIRKNSPAESITADTELGLDCTMVLVDTLVSALRHAREPSGAHHLLASAMKLVK